MKIDLQIVGFFSYENHSEKVDLVSIFPLQ